MGAARRRSQQSAGNRRTFPGSRVLPSKHVKIHRRDAEYAEVPRRLARKRTLTSHGSRRVGARLRATRQVMPAERRQPPRLSRKQSAAFKACKDSPQRRRVRRGAKAPRPHTDLNQPWEPLGVGARLRATRQVMPAERRQPPHLSRKQSAAFKACKDSPQRRRVRRGAKARLWKCPEF
jgi:hypothetical protein